MFKRITDSPDQNSTKFLNGGPQGITTFAPRTFAPRLIYLFR